MVLKSKSVSNKKRAVGRPRNKEIYRANILNDILLVFPKVSPDILAKLLNLSVKDFHRYSSYPGGAGSIPFPAKRLPELRQLLCKVLGSSVGISSFYGFFEESSKKAQRYLNKISD